MPARFEEDGIAFQYPENWGLEREETPSGWTVTLQSPGGNTAFFLLSLDRDMPDLEHVAETALEALREEYPDLEAEDCVEAVAGQPALGHNVRFFSMDLTNTCWLRSLYAAEGTVLAMWQMNDLEEDENLPVLKAICASLEVAEEAE